MSTPSPNTPEAQASRQAGSALAAQHLFSHPTIDLAALRKAVGALRATYLGSGDWEGVWQTAGALDVIREAEQETAAA